jgi:TRAP-type C4-dicarboxylate transport system permease small subunit
VGESNLLKKFVSIFDQTLNIMAFLAGIIIIFVMLSVCLEVILRDFFNKPQIWVTQVTECLLLYITFLCSAWLLREEGHIKVDILLDYLRPRTGAFLGIISSAIGIVVSVVITIFGFNLTLLYFIKGTYTPTVLEIPLSWIILIIPVGSLMLSVQFVRRTFKFVAGFVIESQKLKS